MFFDGLLIIPLALLLDGLLGDPPTKFHPTAWMGNLIAFVLRFRPWDDPAHEFVFGLLLTLGGMTFVATVGSGLQIIIDQLIPLWARVLLQAVILKMTLSLRGLDRAAHEVQTALEIGNLPEARSLLSWHLVSRDTSSLDAAHISAAAIESVAENASDGSIAPLFFFALGGLPLALAYRFLNTADSMVGYHNAAFEWLGKFPARLDDIFNFIPARLAGLCIVIASFFVPYASGQTAWRILRRDACLTLSPNAGFPMSAMSGALGVELEKIGHYTLGRGMRVSTPDDLACARRILRIAVGLAALLLTGLVYYVESH